MTLALWTLTTSSARRVAAFAERAEAAGWHGMAVAGPPERCVERLREIAALGIDKVIVIGPTAGADAAEARKSIQLLHAEVLPAFP
jgi:alkanesulfonate monooxygenase SsuD/methylene tetrahydromethanopterin reductase-like flavin-dependent oxidoreductase (luciferase family)